MNDKVSIIVPIYNAEKYIKRCLSAITNQTYKNIEIILINDGSKDNSNTLCQKYASNDKRIVYINKKNEGVSATRNIGLQNATGKYVYFIDADDTIDENQIKVLLKEMKNDVVAVNTSINTIEGNHIKQKKQNYEISIKDYQKEFIEKKSAVRCWGWLLKSDIAKQIHFDTNTSYMEDTLYILEYIFKYKKGTISFTDKTFYNYYVNSNSIVNDPQNMLKNINSVVYTISKINDLYKKNSLNFSYKEKLLLREIYLLENISRNAKYKDYDYLMNNDKLLNELKEISKIKIKTRYRVFTYIILNHKKTLLLLYLTFRKVAKKIKKGR